MKLINKRGNHGSFIYSFLILLGFIIPITSITGCANNGDEKVSQEENKIKSNSQMSVEQNKQEGFDISKIKLCELVPDELVAKTLNAKTISSAQSSDMGPSHGCTYTVDPAGPDNMEICIVWLNPTYTFTSPEDELETAMGLGQEATSEYLEGFGDKAYVIHNKTEDQSIIHVLLKDKLDLQVAVEHFDDAKKLTGLILSKLEGI